VSPLGAIQGEDDPGDIADLAVDEGTVELLLEGGSGLGAYQAVIESLTEPYAQSLLEEGTTTTAETMGLDEYVVHVADVVVETARSAARQRQMDEGDRIRLQTEIEAEDPFEVDEVDMSTTENMFMAPERDESEDAEMSPELVRSTRHPCVQQTLANKHIGVEPPACTFCSRRISS